MSDLLLQKPLFFVVGSTATGKSDLALQFALKNKFEIVNSDSLQVYRSLDIGTAKPPKEEMKMCPHHLFDIVDEGESFTAADYRLKALQVIEEAFLNKNSHGLVFVGGSGFYIQALVKGMYELPPVTEEIKKKVSSMIEDKGWQGCIDWLKSSDPSYAKKLNLNDKYRIQRALEMNFSSGQTVSELQESQKLKQDQAFRYSHHFFGLKVDRDVLRSRVSLRTKKMIDHGWIDEVVRLRQKGLGDWAPMKSVGYLEVQDYLDHNFSKEELVQKVVQSTMRLAKKQSTWFRNQLEVQWSQSMEDALKMMQAQLEKSTASGA